MSHYYIRLLTPGDRLKVCRGQLYLVSNLTGADENLLESGIIDFDSEDAVSAGFIRGFLEKQGNPIASYDVQIAGQAVAKSLTLITHNVGEFSRVPGINVEDWMV